jgi:ribonuclease P protein component
MIGRQFRFRGHSSLGFVYKRGTTVRGPLLSLRFTPNSRQQHWRAAVVVSRKVHKSAVVRSRIRRRIYEIVRAEMPEDFSPHDLVFTAFSDKLAEVSHDELRTSVRQLIKRANLR